MKAPGLVHVNVGVGSDDDEILRIIKKGLRTACNFMLGFPEDTRASLARTLRFM